MKTKINFLSAFLLTGSLLVVQFGCKKDKIEKPAVTVPDVETSSLYVWDDNVQAKTIMYSDGGSEITAKGVCWSASSNPTISDSHTTDGSGNGTFSSSFTVTTPGTYYLRPYATNRVGTGYGQIESEFKIESSALSSLNGIWDYGQFEFKIAGANGTFTEINSGPWLSAKNGGFISIGSQWLKNITEKGNNTWNCDVLWFAGSNEVVQVVFWSSMGIITLSDDGTYFTLYSEATYNGNLYSDTGTLTRKQKSAAKSTPSSSNTSRWGGPTMCGWY
ncbi:MAG: hypothetical protein NT004_08535 [Bacteroidetes bacterium]|nr:hypothetical protein [Bacteroidota bacterium]